MIRIDRRACLATLLVATGASAMGRSPIDGTLSLKVPWPVSSIDPHRLDDATAALFGPAVCDPLFGLSPTGRPYPSLASAHPVRTAGGVQVTLRPYLRSARGRSLDARDVVFSLTRSRRLGGLAVLAPLPTPRMVANDPLSIVFRGAEPEAVAAALASPVTALVPRGFDPRAPDGTGAFVAKVGPRRLALDRNVHASRGASFLKRVIVDRATDLADALRSFEAGDVDVGWLGRGLHRPRRGAVPFDAGAIGWIVLRTGRMAGAWGAPGVAQRLLDGIPPGRFAHLGLGRLPAPAASPAWGGPAADLLTPEDSPHLVEIARVLADVLGRPGHEVRPRASPRRELRRKAATGRFTLMLDVCRRVGPSDAETLAALATAADRNIAKRLPKLASYAPRQVTRTLPLGVVGELRVAGALAPGVNLNGWDLASAWR